MPESKESARSIKNTNRSFQKNIFLKRKRMEGKKSMRFSFIGNLWKFKWFLFLHTLVFLSSDKIVPIFFPITWVTLYQHFCSLFHVFHLQNMAMLIKI